MKFSPLALLLVSSAVLADSASIEWSAVTTNADGSTPSGPVSYNLYEQVSPGGGFIQIVGGITATSQVVQGLPAGATICFTVTATAPGEFESAQSAPGCKNTAQATLATPTGVIVK